MAAYATHVIDSLYELMYPEVNPSTYDRLLSHADYMQEVIGAFKVTPEGGECTVRYDHSKFLLRCPQRNSEPALSVFHEIFTKYNETETGAKPTDIFELPKVRRKAGTVVAYDATAIYGLSANDARKTTHEPISLAGSLIYHDSVLRTFETSPSDRFPLQTLRALEKLTSCILDFNEASGKITVMGNNVDDAERALKKLTVLSESKARRNSQMITTNVYVSENEANFVFAFQEPRNIIDRRILTSKKDFLSQYVEMYMAKWDSTTKKWMPVRRGPTSNDQNEAVYPWSEYEYPALGSEEEGISSSEANVVVGRSSLAPEEITKLAVWTRNIPTQLEDPFKATSPSLSEPPKATRSRLVVKGQTEASIADPPPITEPEMPIKPEVLPVFEVDDTILAQVQANGITSKLAYREKGPLIDHPELVHDPSSVLSTQNGVIQWENTAEVFQAPSPRASQVRVDQYFKRKYADMEREFGRRSLPASNASILSNEKKENNPGKNPVSKPGATPALSLPSSKQTKQTQPDRSKQAALARTPISGLGKIEAPPIIQRVSEQIRNILEMARTSYGRVALEVAIGRIYLAGSSIDTTKVLEQRDWLSIFETKVVESQDLAVFSGALSTSWADISFLLDLKFPSSIKPFNTLIAKQVTYVISCINLGTDQDFVFEVDHNGMNAIYSPPQLIGSVNCHFPKRNWDASIRVTESIPANLRPWDPLMSVVENLWVRSGSRIVIGGRTSQPEIMVTSIAVRRQTVYPFTNNSQLLLRMTEVQELVMLPSPERQFQAYAAPENLMIEDDNHIWWEASITSSAADKILEENLTLELGEVAKWSVEDSLDMSIIRDMFRLAEQIVTRIDRVGQRSSVKKPTSATPSNPRSRTSNSKIQRIQMHSEKYQSDMLGWSEW